MPKDKYYGLHSTEPQSRKVLAEMERKRKAAQKKKVKKKVKRKKNPSIDSLLAPDPMAKKTKKTKKNAK